MGRAFAVQKLCTSMITGNVFWAPCRQYIRTEEELKTIVSDLQSKYPKTKFRGVELVENVICGETANLIPEVTNG